MPEPIEDPQPVPEPTPTPAPTEGPAAPESLSPVPVQPTNETRRWFRINALAEPGVAEIQFYDAIGSEFDGVTAKSFVAELAALPPDTRCIRMHMNCPGGNVFDALAIANALKAHQATVEASIEGLCASAATVVTQGGADKVAIADNALVMIHNPSSFAFGTADMLRNAAAALERCTSAIVATYQRKSPLSAQKLANMMEAVTWMDADEAIAFGFADTKEPGCAPMACLDKRSLAALPKVPAQLVDRVQALVRPETPPAPEPPKPPATAVAAAADVVSLCAAAELDVSYAQGLLAENLTPIAAQVRIAAEKERRVAAHARETEIRSICQVSHLEALADSYVAGGMPVEAVRQQAQQIAALVDQSRPTDTSLNPDHGHKRAAVIDIAAVYAERNGLRAKNKE